MKILTKEEEAAHYNATVRGGLIGGGLGLVVVSFNFKYLHFRPRSLSLFRLVTNTISRAEPWSTLPINASRRSAPSPSP
jgi:hypothetical protein